MEVSGKIMRDLNDAESKVVQGPLPSTQVERFRRRLIRTTVRLLKENKAEEEIWQQMKKETTCDCQQLWERMKSLTRKKLVKLFIAEDKLENIKKIAQLSVTDWLLYDLVLAHEKVDVIGQSLPNKKEPQILRELFKLVVEFDLEYSCGQHLVKQWFNATAKYNNIGKRQISPMLLQKRWYQLKELSRSNFYNFWFEYRGDVKKLDRAKIFKPTDLHMDIVKMYKEIVTKPFPSWEEMIKAKKVVLAEDFEQFRLERQKQTLSENEPDLQVIEPYAETIDLDDTNDQINKINKDDNERSGGSSIGKAKVVPEQDDVSVLESVYIPLENSRINDVDDVTTENNYETDTDDVIVTDNEQIMPKIASVVGAADLPNESVVVNESESDVEIDEGPSLKTAVHVKTILEEIVTKVVDIKSNSTESAESSKDFEPNVTRDFEPNVRKDFEPNIRKNFEPNTSKNFKPNVSNDFKPNVTKIFEPKVSKDFEPKVSKVFEPNVSKDFELNATKNFEPKVSKDFKPKVIKDFEPNVSKDFEPNVSKDFKTNVNKDFELNVTKNFEPKVSKDFEPNVSKDFEPKPSKDFEPNVSKIFEPNVSKDFEPDASKDIDKLSSNATDINKDKDDKDLNKDKSISRKVNSIKSEDNITVVNDTDFDFFSSDFNFLEDGIEFEDDGIVYVDEDFSSVSKESCEAKVNNKTEMKIDQKLLLTPLVYTTKLDHMDVFRFLDYNVVTDKRVLESALLESKPTFAKSFNDTDITQESESEDEGGIDDTENDENNINLSSWYFQKPKVKSYNPIQLCKNPDFNTRLKRLPAAFYASERNRWQLKQCKPLTIDLNKAFECLLIDNTLYLQNDNKDPYIKEAYEEIPVKDIAEPPPPPNINDSIDKSSVEIKTSLEERSEIQPEAHFERNKVINLPNIDQIRRLNQGLLIAEVSPILVSNTVNQPDDVKPPIPLLKKYQQDIPDSLFPSDRVETINEVEIVKEIEKINEVENVNVAENIVKVETINEVENVNVAENIVKVETVNEVENIIKAENVTKPANNNGVENITKLESTYEVAYSNEVAFSSKITATHNKGDGLLKIKYDCNDIKKIEIPEINVSENVSNETQKSKRPYNKNKQKQKPTYKKPLPCKQALSWYPKIPALNINSSDCLLADDTVERILCLCKDDYVPKTLKAKRKKKSLQNKEATVTHENQKPEEVSSPAVEKGKVVEKKRRRSKDDKEKSHNNSKKRKKIMADMTTNFKSVCCWARYNINQLTKGIENTGNETLTHSCPKNLCNCCCKMALHLKIDENKMKNDPIVVSDEEAVLKVSVGINTDYDKEFEDQFAANLSLINNITSTPTPIITLPFGHIPSTFSNESGCQTSTPSYIESPSPRKISKNNLVDDNLKRNKIRKAKLPICLGKNKILLCSFKTIENGSDFQRSKNLSINENNAAVLPLGCQLVLLPNRQLGISMEPGVELDEDQLAKVQTIMKLVETQINMNPNNEIQTPLVLDKAANDQINMPDSEITSPCKNLEPNLQTPSERNLDNSRANIGTVFNIEQTVPSTETSNSLTDQNQLCDSQTVNVESSKTTNNVNPVSSKKTILSDLMELSGISPDDVNINNDTNVAVDPCMPKILNVSSISETPYPVISASILQKGYNNVSMRVTSEPLSNNSVVRAALLRCPELNTVSSFSQLKYACQNHAQFFKMDIETGIIVPINVCIKKNRKLIGISPIKNIQSAPQSVIDLTVDDVTNEEALNYPEPALCYDIDQVENISNQALNKSDQSINNPDQAVKDSEQAVKDSEQAVKDLEQTMENLEQTMEDSEKTQNISVSKPNNEIKDPQPNDSSFIECKENEENDLDREQKCLVKPIKMFKAIHPTILRYPGKSLLVRPLKNSDVIQHRSKGSIKHKRKQELITKDKVKSSSEDEGAISRVAGSKKVDNEDESDDEPLAKKSKRTNYASEINMNKTIASQLERLEHLKRALNNVDRNLTPRLEPIVFDDNEGQTSDDDCCILGV